MIKYKKYCPSCKIEIQFASKYNLEKFIERNAKCRKCCMLDEQVRKKLSLHCGRNGIKNAMYGKKHTSESRKKMSINTKKAMNRPEIKEKMNKIKNSTEYRRKLSSALKGRKFSDETIEKMSMSKKDNKYCVGRILSNKTKNKISKSNTGKKHPHSDETKRKISIANSNFSDETKRRMRLARIKQIQRDKFNGNQVIPSYNPNACKIIDEYGKNHGYDFQHAMNGGEHFISNLGYWVDGYDKNKNVVIEVDEKRHFDVNGNLNVKDIKRQNEIEKYLKCQFIRVKFQEIIDA